MNSQLRAAIDEQEAARLALHTIVEQLLWAQVEALEQGKWHAYEEAGHRMLAAQKRLGEALDIVATLRSSGRPPVAG